MLGAKLRHCNHNHRGVAVKKMRPGCDAAELDA